MQNLLHHLPNEHEFTDVMLLTYTCLVVMMQALDSFKAESESELNLSAGDIVIVRKVIYLCCPCFVIFN